MAKGKRVLKRIVIVFGVIVVLLAGALFAWSHFGTYPAGPVARAALGSSNGVEVIEDQFIRFEPRDGFDHGLIFYPGGLVDPRAYAPVLKTLAEVGYLVVITPMPLNLGIFNTGAANGVFEAYPQVESWALAGHSLGGASAAIFAGGNSSALDGLIFMDSYPPASSNLSSSNLRVLSIFGTTGGVPNTDGFDDQRYLVPSDTIFAPIEGASHAQFGDYGPQAGDVEPQISLAEQHRIVVDIIKNFLSELFQ